MTYFRDNINKLEGYIPGFQPSGGKIVKLNTNENPFPPSSAVMEAIRSLPEESLRRYPQPLGDSFRKAAAKVLDIEPENIICTNGGDDLLTICFRCFCDETRPVVYPGPTYSLYPVLAAMQNCAVTELSYDDNAWIEKAVDAQAGLLILCNPNAPSGAFIEPSIIGEIAGKVAGKNVVLVDEAYADFAPDNCVSLVKQHNNLIILRSMSKGYSLAGLRFGFGIGDTALIEGLLKVKDSYNVDAVSICAATAAIQDQRYHLETVDKVKQQRQWLTDELRKLDFDVPDSSANFVFARFKQGSAGRLYEELAENFGIYVRYWFEPGLNDKLRISVGTPEQNDALVTALKKILSQ